LSACGAYEKVFIPLKSCHTQNHQNAFEFLDDLSNPLFKSTCPLNGSNNSPSFCAMALMVRSRRSSPEEMLDLGYRQVGKEFPVFLHPGTQEEYALARVTHV
jgi:hypothetical protein